MPDAGAAADASRGPLPPAGPTLELVTASPEETRALAGALAPLLRDGDLIVLTGDLGAGKTCFTQGLGRGLGVASRITSPTFTILAEYEGRVALHHLDAYRLAGVEEAADLDLPELLEEGVTVIEWGDRLAPALPDDHLRIEITLGRGDDDRSFVVTGGGRWALDDRDLGAALRPWSTTRGAAC